jgi:stringent starvation protein B
MEPKDKRRVVEDLLAEGDTMICVDSRYAGVRVPEAHRGKEDLRLVLNLRFRGRISVLHDGIQAELRFGGEPFLCWIPYESLWAAYNPQTGQGTLWPEKTPAGQRDLLGVSKPSSEGERRKTKGEGAGPSSEVVTPMARQKPPEGLPRSERPPPPGPEKSGQKGRSRFRVIDGGKKE